jgi:hypothetical protein
MINSGSSAYAVIFALEVLVYIPVTIAHMYAWCSRGYSTTADRMISYNAQYYRCIAEPIFMAIFTGLLVAMDEGRKIRAYGALSTTIVVVIVTVQVIITLFV